MVEGKNQEQIVTNGQVFTNPMRCITERKAVCQILIPLFTGDIFD